MVPGNPSSAARGRSGPAEVFVYQIADPAVSPHAELGDFTHYHIQGILAATAGPLTGLCTEIASLLVR